MGRAQTAADEGAQPLAVRTAPRCIFCSGASCGPFLRCLVPNNSSISLTPSSGSCATPTFGVCRAAPPIGDSDSDSAATLS